MSVVRFVAIANDRSMGSRDSFIVQSGAIVAFGIIDIHFVLHDFTALFSDLDVLDPLRLRLLASPRVIDTVQ